MKNVGYFDNVTIHGDDWNWSSLGRSRFDEVRQDKADETANEIAEEYVNQRNPTDLAILFWI